MRASEAWFIFCGAIGLSIEIFFERQFDTTE